MATLQHLTLSRRCRIERKDIDVVSDAVPLAASARTISIQDSTHVTVYYLLTKCCTQPDQMSISQTQTLACNISRQASDIQHMH